MVEIEQVDTNLAADIKIRSLDSIDPEKLSGFSLDVPDEKCIFLTEQFQNYGFGETVQFGGDGTFCINLLSELPHKAAAGLHNRQAWMIFAAHNVKPIKRGVKCEMYQNVIVSLQNYLFELSPGCDSGYIQFYSLPDICRCDGRLYRQNSLMHISVFRNQKARRISPEMISVKPGGADKTYVAMLPTQKLQIITPSYASLGITSPKLSVVDVDEKTLVNGGRVTSTVVRCDQLLDRGEIIEVQMGKWQTAIWLTGIVSSQEGGLYPFFNKPDRKTNLISYNMAGFAILDDADPNWLIDDIASIAQGEVGTIATFTTPQKSVSIEQTEGYWWLSASDAYALDTVT